MIKEFFKDLTQARTLKFSVLDTLKWMITNLETRKRILITMGAIVILQVAAFIPLPGIDISVLQELFHRISRTQSGLLIGMIQLFSGGALDRLRIFALGLMPFFSACLLLQLTTIFIPKLRRYSFCGEVGRDKMAKFTYIFTIILSVVQAYFIALWLENPARFEGLRLVANPGFGFRLMVIVTITASVLLLLFVADIINKHGIGNGVAVIAVSPFILKVVLAINTIIYLMQSGKVPLGFVLILFAVFAGIAYVTFYITTRAKPIEISDNKNKTVVVLRSSIVGDQPIGWGTGLILFPLTIASFSSSAWAQNLASWITKVPIFNIAIASVLIIVFTYLYALIVFDPKYLNRLVSKHGFLLSSINDKTPEDFLDSCMSKVLILTALVLLVINLLPSLITSYLKMPFLIASLFGGTIVLFGVGVFSDILHQAEFFKNKVESGIKDWTICYMAFDEFEASIKAEFLKNKGIQVLIEPFRFTWGMPVRTIVDQYKIYVPSEKKDEARNLLVTICENVR